MMKFGKLKRLLDKNSRHIEYHDKNTERIFEDCNVWFGTNPDEWDAYKKQMESPFLNENMLLGYAGGLGCKHTSDTLIKYAIDTKRIGRGLNALVFSGVGTGRTFRYIEPNIAQANSSYIISDPTGEIFQTMGKMLQEDGYRVYVFNTDAPKHSNCYNPFDHIRNATGSIDLQTITEFAKLIIYADSHTEDFDPLWDKTSLAFLTFAIIYIATYCPPEKRNLCQVLEVLYAEKAKLYDQAENMQPNDFATRLEAEEPDAECLYYYRLYKAAPLETAKSVLLNINIILSLFATDEMCNLTSTAYKTEENIDLKILGQQKTALFLITKHTDGINNFLNKILCTQIYRELTADNSRLPVHVTFMLDNFAYGPHMLSVEKLAVCNSYNISYTLFVDSLTPLRKIFGDTYKLALDNMDIIIFMGSTEKETLKFVSKTLGYTIYKTIGKDLRLPFARRIIKRQQSECRYYKKQPLISPKQLAKLPDDDCIVRIRGYMPMRLKKLDFPKHPKFTQSGAGDEANKLNIDEFINLSPPYTSFKERGFLG